MKIYIREFNGLSSTDTYIIICHTALTLVSNISLTSNNDLVAGGLLLTVIHKTNAHELASKHPCLHEINNVKLEYCSTSLVNKVGNTELLYYARMHENVSKNTTYFAYYSRFVIV